MSEVPTPNISENLHIVNIKVFLDGNTDPIDATYQIKEVSIFHKIYKIGKAEIQLIDGDVAEGSFPIMESNEFVPGTPVKIEIGYGTGEENEVAFQGIISQVEVHTHSRRKPLLVVKCVDTAYKMTIHNQYLIYENKTDGDLFNEICDRYDELDSGEIATTSFEHPSIIQFGLSDWDFLLQRAKNIGLILYTKEGELIIKHPETSNKSIKVSFGRDIIRQQLNFSARSVFDDVSASSWNATDQVLRTENAEEISLPEQGDTNVETSSVSPRFMRAPQRLLSHADWDTPVIGDWASGKRLEYELNKIHGTIVIPGSNAPRLDSVIEIEKLGNYFSGEGYITGVNHHVIDGGWTTKISIGLKRETIFSSSSTDTPTFNPGSFSNLLIGIVKQIHDDPAGNARILVEIPGLEGEAEGVWARVLQQYATNGAGNMVFPEPGNEVLLGFLSNDPQSPIVLGSLYSQTNAPPFQLEEDNLVKSFVSREQLQLSFNEERKEISLVTPEGNTAILSDEDGGIRLEDQHGNKVELSDRGIGLESSSDVLIKASGNINLEADGEIIIKSRADLSAEGMNVALNANMKIEQTANIIESKATAQSVIKGGIVQIN